MCAPHAVVSDHRVVGLLKLDGVHVGAAHVIPPVITVVLVVVVVVVAVALVRPATIHHGRTRQGVRVDRIL